MTAPRERTLGEQLSRPLAAFWRGGAGPTHGEVDEVLRAEGLDLSAYSGSKADKVTQALAEADDQTAVDLATGLVALLESDGALDAETSDGERQLRGLRVALAAVGAELTPDGRLAWESTPSRSNALVDQGPLQHPPLTSPAAPSRPVPGSSVQLARRMDDPPRTPCRPTALLSWAHAPNPEVTTGAWRDTVLNLVTGLRVHGGVLVDMDLFHLSDPAVDWTRFGPRAAQNSDLVIVAINQAWAQRWEGRNDPTEGAGAAAEADVLHGLFNNNQQEFQRRVLIVVLPGASASDIPPGLQRLQRYHVDEPTIDGLTELLRRVHGQPEFLPFPVGDIPVLPPHAVPGAGNTGTGRVSHSRTASQALTVADTAQAVVDAAHATPLSPARDVDIVDALSTATRAEGMATADLEAWRAVLRSALRALPTPQDGETAALPWHRAYADTRQQLDGVDRRLAEIGDAPLDWRPALAQLRAGLRPEGRGWLLVAVAPVPSKPTPRLTVEQVRQDLLLWQQQGSWPWPLNFSCWAYRDSGRVAFTGHHTRVRLEQEIHDDLRAAGLDIPVPDIEPERSTAWRLEVADSGVLTLGAALPDPVTAVGGTTARAGQPGEVALDADLVLEVRRDAVELWLLAALSAAAHRLRDRPGSTPVDFAVQLAADAAGSPPGHHQVGARRMRLVDSPRHPDRPEEPPSLVPGSRTLPMKDLPAATRRVQARHLLEATDRVSTARAIALDLLDHFGAEDTAVLRDGALEPRAANVADQQLVYQYAQQMGLPVQEPSPLQRRDRAKQLRAEADALLAPPL